MTFRKYGLFVLGLSIAGWIGSSAINAQSVQTQESSQVHAKKHVVVSKKANSKKKVVVKATKKQSVSIKKVSEKKITPQTKVIQKPAQVRSSQISSQKVTPAPIQRPRVAVIPPLPVSQPVKAKVEAPLPVKEPRVADRSGDKDIEIELSGVVEPTSVKRDSVQGVSLWTSIPILKDDASRRLFSLSSQSVKLKAILVQDGNGKWVLKVKSVEAIGDR